MNFGINLYFYHMNSIFINYLLIILICRKKIKSYIYDKKQICVCTLERTDVGCLCSLWLMWKTMTTPLYQNRHNGIKSFVWATHRTLHVGIKHAHLWITNYIGHGNHITDMNILTMTPTNIRRHTWSPTRIKRCVWASTQRHL